MENRVDLAVPACQAPLFPDPIVGVTPFGSLTVVAGASGAGKTILMAEAMQRIRSGRTFFGHQTNPCTDYYVIAADRDWSTYARAYEAAGFPDINRYVLAEDPDFDPRNWGRKSTAFTLFEDCLKKLAPKPGSIVNTDPVAPLFIQGSQNEARDVALSLHWFRKLAQQYQITLVLFANVGKQKTDDVYRRAQDRIAGSGAFVAYSDTQISVEQDAEGVVTVSLTPRAGKVEEHQLKFNPETGLFELYLDTASATAVDANNLPAHLAASFAFVPELPQTITSPLLVRKICEYGIKRAMAYRHIQQLIELALIIKNEYGVIMRVDQTPISRNP